MDEQETKIAHIHKCDKSVMKVLWVFAIALFYPITLYSQMRLLI
jgi:hypothetical protein